VNTNKQRKTSFDNPLKEDLDHILYHTRDLWDEFRGQNIFITGGTGFLGSWMLESFLWANNKLDLKARATVLTRSPEAFLKKTPHLVTDPAVILYKGDVQSFDFPAGSFSHVIHMATESKSIEKVEDSFKTLDVIINGTRRVLDFSITHDVSKLLFLSSGAVYGKQQSDVLNVTEDYKGGPDLESMESTYGEGKRVGELLCRLYYLKYGIECKIARGFAFAGPYIPLDGHFAFGNFINDVLNNRDILIKGDGTTIRSYLYAADAAIWFWTILCKGKPVYPYNVGSDNPVTILELANKIKAIIKSGSQVVVLNKSISNKTDRYVPSTLRAQKELGLKQYIGLDQSIEKTFFYFNMK